MANLSEDIQWAGSDTRPLMLDRADFESWQQRALHLGPERDRVFANLSPKEKERFKADIRATNILLQGLPKYFYTLINHYTDAKDIWEYVKMLLEGSDLTKDERLTPTDNLIENLTNILALLTESCKTYLPQTNNQLRTSSNIRNQAIVQNGRVVVQNVHGRQNRGQGNNARGAVAAGNRGAQNRVGNANREYFKDKMLLMQAQENGVALDEEQLLFIACKQYNAFDADMDEPLVQDHDDYINNGDEYHEVRKMQHDVQPNYVVESNAEYTSDSNIILYEQYVKDNTKQIVQSIVSSVPNDALMMIINGMHEQYAQCVSDDIK
ncbi:hypothetical protein Tco_1380640 [Tanacetum coccineum]